MQWATDSRGHRLSSSNSGALSACNAGVDGFVHWRADTMSNIDAAIAADNDFALPKIVKAWMMHSARDTAMESDINPLMHEAERCLDSQNDRDIDLLAALKQARQGRSVEAATLLEGVLDRYPTDLLSHRLVQFELFWNGRASWMRDITERAATHWNADTIGYGPFLSMRAFANEEAGCYAAAEQFGRMAVEIDNGDVWGAHAVAHVLVMKGQIGAGVEWLDNLSVHWGHANQIRHHLWWHLSLFLLELKKYDQILELLTEHSRNPDSPLVQAAPQATIDLQNFASLLMRLELQGVDVAEHWLVYRDICADRVHNHANAFINAHDMMVLAATDQFDKANELLGSMRTFAEQDSGSVMTAYSAVGIAVCEAILAHRQKNYAAVLRLLAPVRHDLHLMGASHTQRDVFYQLLIDSARRENKPDLESIFIRDVERIGFFNVSDRIAYQPRQSEVN